MHELSELRLAALVTMLRSDPVSSSLGKRGLQTPVPRIGCLRRACYSGLWIPMEPLGWGRALENKIDDMRAHRKWEVVYTHVGGRQVHSVT